MLKKLTVIMVLSFSIMYGMDGKRSVVDAKYKVMMAKLVASDTRRKESFREIMKLMEESEKKHLETIDSIHSEASEIESKLDSAASTIESEINSFTSAIESKLDSVIEGIKPSRQEASVPKYSDLEYDAHCLRLQNNSIPEEKPLTPRSAFLRNTGDF